MKTYVVAALFLCVAAVSGAPSGPWAAPYYIVPHQPIYLSKPLVSGWEAPAKNDGWAAATPAPPKPTTTAAPVKNDGWAAPAAWAPAKADPWAASAWSTQSHVVLKPAIVPLKTVKYIAAPHYYVSPHHAW